MDIGGPKCLLSKPKTSRSPSVWKHHRKAAAKAHPKGHFQWAIKSAGGPSAFKWAVIWRGPVEDLNAKEIYYIRKHHTFADDPLCRGYNMTTGSDGQSPGFTHSKKTKKKMSAAHLRSYKEHPERRQKQSTTMKRHFEDNPEAREKYRDAQIRRYENPSEREKDRVIQLRRFELMTEADRKVYWHSIHPNGNCLGCSKRPKVK